MKLVKGNFWVDVKDTRNLQEGREHTYSDRGIFVAQSGTAPLREPFIINMHMPW